MKSYDKVYFTDGEDKSLLAVPKREETEPAKKRLRSSDIGQYCSSIIRASLPWNFRLARTQTVAIKTN